MRKKRTVDAPVRDAVDRLPFTSEGNRLLLEWLMDDEHRAALFKLINEGEGVLWFPSRDTWQRDCDDCGLTWPRPDPETGHRGVRLVTCRQEIEAILRDDGRQYSNRVYAELGGGSFMLALDPQLGTAHREQIAVYRQCFPENKDHLEALSYLACQAASIMALRASDFDLAAFAEQAAVRFCQKLMGYSFVDYRLLEGSLRSAYRGLVYQVLGRHFTTDPTAVPEAKQAMARLLARTSALIDGYAMKDEDVIKGCDDNALPNGFKRVLERMAGYEGAMNAEQLAVIAVGAAVGSVGNVQAAACIAVKAIFADRQLMERARELVSDARPPRMPFGEEEPMPVKVRDRGHRPTCRSAEWKDLIERTLRDNPPIPFLPRLFVKQDGKQQGRAYEEVLLALGGGTWKKRKGKGDDPLVWGLKETGTHWCVGQALAWPLIVEIVRHVMLQPGLAERLDPEDATPLGLTKRWGFACESYPLTHQRERRVAQSSLNVAMRLKSPVKDNADRVREVIRAGAPLIEEALRGARHVHFAWFELIESDTVLVLHTVYDGPFAAYIDHFALKVGDLFDELFACIESPPPMPVKKFPNEFVAHIQRFNKAPAMGYFFSAYPRSDVARILRDELARP